MALIGVAGTIAAIFLNKKLSEKKTEPTKILTLDSTQPIKKQKNKFWIWVAVAAIIGLALLLTRTFLVPALTSVFYPSTPTPLPSPTPTPDPCKNFVSRVYKGEKVHIANLLDKNLNIRKLPSLSAPIITSVQNGTEFQILNGPVCADTLMWWEASTTNGSVRGWIAEENSAGIYYLEP